MTISLSKGLPSWRDVIQPHPDVAAGEYKKAEFAAHLGQVSRGEGAAEYNDPIEFFSRTYLTAGLYELLKMALLRVSGKGGEPVIQLKTAFGGGKTHSMLALYHLLNSKTPLERIPSLQKLLAEAGSLPPTHVATLVGTDINTSEAKSWPELDVQTRTLWGDLGAQIAISAKKPELFEYVRSADEQETPPGAVALAKLFDAAGSCLILMDELVAYARKIYEQGDGGTRFDRFLTFIQEVTEAAVESRASLVVASIPESENEINGAAGQKTLAAIEHYFGRLHTIVKPVEASEGFEIVRRRLFLDCGDMSARDRVCRAYSELYNANPSDFPAQARELEYRKRMEACYPIHPEVFDRLYEDWATLENFQRTRGALRLMATVIHHLWMQNDRAPLIQPGSLPLDAPAVRDELIRGLGDNWQAIVDKEVDGANSLPVKQERINSRYARFSAARRVSRTIMLGSAPTVKGQAVRGIEASRIRLGIVQPGEEVAIFNDALASLQKELSFLYANASGDRFWYDTRPTLLKTAKDRASQIPAHRIQEEIEKRLKKMCKKVPPLAAIHVCPASPADVPDEQAARLVVLDPQASWTGHIDSCPALREANAILEQRGSAPRQYRNMLVFLAPDKATLQSLEQEARSYLAWESIQREREELNLDAHQNHATETALKNATQNVDARVADAWRWLLVPTANSENPGLVHWEESRLSGNEFMIERCVKKIMQDELILAQWAPSLLEKELNDLLWRDRDYLEVDKLWNYLCSYCYLPRLENFATLASAIRQGVSQEGLFAYAAGKSGNGFDDLRLNEDCQIEASGLLVKREIAAAQLEREKGAGPNPESCHMPEAPATASDLHNGPRPANTDSGTGAEKPAPQAEDSPKYTRFYLCADMDRSRLNRDVNKILTEVLNHVGEECELAIRLEVQGVAPQGFQAQTIRAASENCRTLKIASFGFERE